MNKSVQTYSEHIANIATFLGRFKEQYAEAGLTQGNKVDLLAPLYRVQKEIDEFIAAEKKNLDFGNAKEIRGEVAKAKITLKVMTEIPVGPIAQKLKFKDFQRVVKVVKSKLGAFLKKDEIKELEEVTSTSTAISFETL